MAVVTDNRTIGQTGHLSACPALEGPDRPASPKGGCPSVRFPVRQIALDPVRHREGSEEGKPSPGAGAPMDVLISGDHRSPAIGRKAAVENSDCAPSVLGIDPGLSGAVAVVTPSGDLIDVFDMPILRDGAKGRATVNAPLLAEIIRKTGATTAFVEFVGARPGEGAVGAFAFGRCRGVIEGVSAAFGLPIAFLTPPSWKRAVGIPPGKDGAKDAARSEAIRRWPAMASKFARVKDDGRAEAALIAVAGLKKGNAE